MFSLHIDTAETWRGGQNQVLLTVRQLRALGHRTALMAHPGGELFRRFSNDPDLIGLAPRTEPDLATAWRLSRLLRQLRPAVVHAHDPHGVAAAALARSFSPRNGKPALVASRRVDFRLKGNSFSRWKYRQVDAFIASSDAIREILISDGIAADRIVTVHEGVDIGKILAIPPSDVRAAFDFPAHSPVIGNIAALVPHKGQKHLIDAAALVVERLPYARFVILGEGELRPALERQIRDLRLERHVILAGFRKDVRALLKTFDIFVMSSVMEGLGTSLLDAMACSRPIVATQAGGIPEVVAHEETGLIVPARDHRLMARALVKILEDEQLQRRMGEAGFERVTEFFSAARMAEKTLEVYGRVAGTHHAEDSDYLPVSG
jgi:L-malate glycosyltransferase